MMTFLARSTFLAIVAAQFVNPALASEFYGYRCTKDCSGHRAGFAWAERKEIQNKHNCTGHSQSFREGCLAWVSSKEAKTEKAKAGTNEPSKPEQAVSIDRD